MSRVRRGSKARQRRNKVLKYAKGFTYDRRTKYRRAAETVKRALFNVYKGRRLLKREMRRLWIIRINAGARLLNLSYSRFMNNLKQNDVLLNRKMLAELAARDFASFEYIVDKVSKK
jgi:large subunit ribosomal protein L20